MKYTHLTQDERYQIAIFAKAGHDQSDIARVMNRHKSSIGREMKRNRVEIANGSGERQSIQISISIGVASLNVDIESKEQLVQAADQALYRAKREGRNRVIVAMTGSR